MFVMIECDDRSNANEFQYIHTYKNLVGSRCFSCSRLKLNMSYDGGLRHHFVI